MGGGQRGDTQGTSEKLGYLQVESSIPLSVQVLEGIASISFKDTLPDELCYSIPSLDRTASHADSIPQDMASQRPWESRSQLTGSASPANSRHSSTPSGALLPSYEVRNNPYKEKKTCKTISIVLREYS